VGAEEVDEQQEREDEQNGSSEHARAQHYLTPGRVATLGVIE
jgi:hypothetical protein